MHAWHWPSCKYVGMHKFLQVFFLNEIMCVGPDVSKDKSTISTDGKTEIKLITGKELRSHNTPKDAWAAVDGKVLDITKFAERHPGGDLILLAAGKDATVLYKTYHPRGVPSSLIHKLTVSGINGAF